MNTLIIDTTRKLAKILISKDDKHFVFDMSDKIKHSEGLFLYLEKALSETKLKISDFDVLSGVVGPGSFTGIRVGMSVIKGFNQVINKPVVPINIFEVLRYGVKNGVILLNSTSTTCYKADIRNFEIVDKGVINKLEISSISGDIYILKEEQDELGIEYNNIRVIADYSSYYFLAIENKLKKKSNELFEPLYLQLSQAEKNLK